jgi:predicted DNA-binding protein
MAEKTYVTTLRLPMALYEEVELVARAEDKPVSEVIREAIAAHIKRRRADPEFQARLKKRLKDDAKILRKLEAG